MPGWYLATATASVVVLAVLLIVRARLHPALVLALAATAVGLLTGLGAEGTVEAVTCSVAVSIASVIALGLVVALGTAR